MVFTPEMCSCRWSIGNNVIGKDGRVSTVEVPTNAMKHKSMLDEFNLYTGGTGVVKIYNLFRFFNNRHGDFHDGDYFAQNKMYAMPEKSEDLMNDLAELSLTHNIVAVEQREYGIGIVVMASTDGTTNIDANVIESVASAFKE